jgi:isoleucyl-tRNA synthetase
MQLAQTVSSLVHSLRKKETIKVRQPLSRILIPVLNENTKHQIEAVADLIKSEVNVKDIQYIDDTSGVLVKKIKPNFKRLGQVYGPRLKEVAAVIQSMNQEQIAQLERGNSYPVTLGAEQVVITLEDVEIMSEDIPGWLVASEGKLTVALDIKLTEELKQEGIARDLVNRIQNLRKDSGMDVQDKIRIFLQNNNTEVNRAVAAYGGYIQEETQATQVELKETVTEGTTLEIDEFTLQAKLEVV